MSGTGVRGTGGALVIAPSSAAFGNVTVGSTSPTLSFTATNHTTATVRYLSSSGSASFKVQPGTCHLVNGDAMLSPGASCVFTVQFAPMAIGLATGSITISTNLGPVVFPMSGTGVSAAPVANPGGPYTGTTGVAVSFSGSKSTGPSGQTLSYAWSFGDGTTGTGVSPTHSYTTAGNYIVSLTVRASGDGISTAVATTAAIVFRTGGEPRRAL